MRSDRLSVSGGKGRGSLNMGEDVEILEVHEKHGSLYNAIPRMPVALAVVLCILNIIVPGLGEYRLTFSYYY